MFRDIRKANNSNIESLSRLWGVRNETIERLNIGVTDGGWTIPMYNTRGTIVGYRIRWFKGGKGTNKGGHLGLFIPEGMRPQWVQVITEGESDLAAAFDIGLKAVGWPSSVACKDEIVLYCAPQKFNAINIIADRDDNGIAEPEAQNIADLLLTDGHIVKVIVPPKPYKDLREWYNDTRITLKEFQDHTEKFQYQTPDRCPHGFFAIGNWQVKSGLIAEIGLVAFSVLCAIASFSDRNGFCRTQDEKVAEIIGLNGKFRKRTVERHRKKLKSIGLLETVVIGHSGRESVYRINLDPFNFKK